MHFEMLSNVLPLVHDITNITVFCHLPQILLLYNILIFNNFAWIWENFVRRTPKAKFCPANPNTLPDLTLYTLHYHVEMLFHE